MRTCLIVDDSETIRKVAGAILAEVKFIVSHAETTEDAFNACAQFMPDVILLDWHIPGSKPLDFIRHLKIAFPDTAARIIYFTTDADVDVINEALEAGADDYLMKPFDRTSLVTKLANQQLAA